MSPVLLLVHLPLLRGSLLLRASAAGAAGAPPKPAQWPVRQSRPWRRRLPKWGGGSCHGCVAQSPLVNIQNLLSIREHMLLGRELLPRISRRSTTLLFSKPVPGSVKIACRYPRIIKTAVRRISVP